MRKKYDNFILGKKPIILFFVLILVASQIISCNSTKDFISSEKTDTSVEVNNQSTEELNDVNSSNSSKMVEGRIEPPSGFDSDRPEPPSGFGGGMPGGGNSKPTSYDAVNVYDEDQSISELNINSTNDDESAILVSNSANVKINDFNITRENNNSSGGDSASFYGVGAAVLVTDGILTLDNGVITTNSKGGAGVFAYDKGIAYVNNATISTTKDTSGGIHVAGGGTLYATNVTAMTNGESSAAIRSDRGGGVMYVDGGTFITNGSGSPALYCTADITVNDATLIANGSEGICIEGLNTTTLKNVNLTSNMPDQDQNDNTWSVIVYQSMSGDSQIGKGTFNMEGGTLTSKNGGIFYTTNTESEFNITNVDLKPSDGFEYLLRVTGNNNKRGWGSAGSNGADCTFNANEQKMDGNVVCDSISSLNFNVLNNSIFTGAILSDESSTNGVEGSGVSNVTIDSNSKWVVTANSTITKLSLKGELVDTAGNNVKIIDTNETILRDGDSEFVVTVKTLE